MQAQRKSAETRGNEEIITAEAIEAALENGEMEVYFQEIVEAKVPYKMVGMEALIRWTKPDGEKVSPELFISIAEKSGLIHKITAFVLESVVWQIRSWLDQGYRVPRIAFNVPPSVFDPASRQDLYRQIHELLKQNEVPGDQLAVEITERSEIPELSKKTRHDLNALKIAGIKIEQDDFADGQAGLKVQDKIPYDVYKIHYSHLQDENLTDETKAMLKKVADQDAKIELVVEGIGTSRILLEARNQIIKSGIDLDNVRFQGYRFAEPVPATQIERHMKIVHPPGFRRVA